MAFDLAKHGLNLKRGFKTKFGLILGSKNHRREENGRRRRRGRGRGRGREEEDEGEKFKQGQKGMELLNLSMGLWFV